MSRADQRPTYRLLDRTARLAVNAAARMQSLSERYAERSTGKVSPPATSVDDIIWFHSIDLGDGRVTPGVKPADTLAAEAVNLNLPSSLAGKSVLDIGAWDGYFSFEAERRGARRVVSLDHYAWAIDHHAYQRYHSEAMRTGNVPKPAEEVGAAWNPATLPGKAGFDLARRQLKSSVRPVVDDFMTMDLRTLGSFDVVFFLGVLYHLKDPFLALRRLCEVTRGVAVIETVAVVLPWVKERLWMFLEAGELNEDPSNWWAPSSAGLTAACRAAGFREARVVIEGPEYSPPNEGYSIQYARIVVHAYA